MPQKITAALLFLILMTGHFMNPLYLTVNQNLEGRVVILDAGHGAEKPNVWEDYFEHVAMLEFAYKLKPLLEARGARVLMTRTTESDVPHSVRCAMINRWALLELRDMEQSYRGIGRLIDIMQSVIDDPEENEEIYFNTPFDYTYEREIHPDLKRIFEYEADSLISDRFLMISLHSNATPLPIDTSQNGVDIFYMSNSLEKNMTYYSGYTNVQRSFYFANLLLDDIGRLGLEKRDISDYYYFMIREHNLPAVLVENGFHTNDEDRAKLSDGAFLDKLAEAYVQAILYYFTVVELNGASVEEYAL